MFEIIAVYPTFDILSEVRRKPMFEKKLPCGPARYIRIFEAFSEHERAFLNFFLSGSWKTSRAYFKLCAFWALNVAPTWNVPLLSDVLFFWISQLESGLWKHANFF